ncbi:hypothetical protein CAPTEDRAFT_209344 [Capitella teleta]|uniref:Uncharacterized protein n=1 Tax=Capitella teleta TaxID=283909 RepID=R7VAZ2_CAPTE|nr:hypothetical protein CAPTEDRAFT_209344 [Capitella teleta]|eukprot:ELU15774.1 hypothetical protein CAPTEDRAFT_209344 [Capitella teleta]
MWHRIWDANGKPGNGVVYDLMLKAKREYKSAVRWVLRHQDELSSMRMADGILNNKSRDLWAEVKKKTHSRCSTPGIVDGVEGDHEIGELFCAKFDELYNCVSYNADEMLELKHSVFDLVSSREVSNTWHRHFLMCIILATKVVEERQWQEAILVWPMISTTT